MSMKPYIVIVCTYIWSDGLSPRTDDQNALTLQSADTNNVPREPLHDPVTLVWYVYNKKVSHVEKKVVEYLINNSKHNFGQ